MMVANVLFFIIKKSKNNSSMLEFCQQCEVYHNVNTLNGQRVLNECQKKINEMLDNDSCSKSGDIIYFNRHDFSPTSKASFTSISAHFLPSIIKQNSIKSNHPIKGTIPQISNRPLPKSQSVIYMQNNSSASLKKPMIKISFIPANKSPQIQNTQIIPQTIPQIPVNMAASQDRQPGAFFKTKPSNLLSTIKQQIGNQSSQARSLKSMESSETKIVIDEIRSTYKFKDLRRASNTLRQQFAAAQRQDKQTDQKQCCCW